MKAITLILITGLCFISQFHSQTNIYHPFPENAIWRVDYYYHNPFQYPCSYRFYFQYQMEGDTLINGSTCQKIMRSPVEADSISCDVIGQPSAPSSGYVGAICEIPDSNKVNFIYPGSETAYLLYDYNMNLGDTLRGLLVQFDTLLVSNKDSIQINGVYHKRWTFTPTPDNVTSYLIEGIGTKAGLMEPLFSYFADFTDHYLVCVKDSTTVYFQTVNTSYPGCNWEVVNQPEISAPTPLQPFPNPCSQQLNIQFANTLADISLSLYSSQGKMILNQTLHHTDRIQLSVIDIPSGLYNLCIKTDQSFHIEKIVIQH
jgi:hypothetical protein